MKNVRIMSDADHITGWMIRTIMETFEKTIKDCSLDANAKDFFRHSICRICHTGSSMLAGSNISSSKNRV